MESWLIQITNYLLAQSWQIAVLTIAVAVASILSRNRSAHVRYLLWLIVLAKCLVPPIYSIPIGILPQEKPITFVARSQIAERNFVSSGMNQDSVIDPIRSTPARVSMTLTHKTIEEPITYNVRAWLAIGWLAGLVILLCYYLLNALRTQIWLQKKRKALSSELACNIENFFRTNGIRHMPRIWLLDRISQPFVWGLVRGSIYLPANLLDDRHAKFQASFLGHELSHVIRFDATINSFQVLAQTVFWFHPFVWWANRKIRDEREKCCDEMTISRFNARPEDYGEAIVETIAAKYEQTRPVPSLAVAGQVKNIEERIKTMLRPGKKFYRRPSVVAMTIMLLLALLTVPTALVLSARAESKTAPETVHKPTKTLHEAAADGDIEQVKLLISKGADVNAKDEGGRTALYIAAGPGRNHTDIAKLLIDAGADVNTEDEDVWTALIEATFGGHKDVAKLLIRAGANVNATNGYGLAPLHYAVWHNNKEVVSLLISKGADVNLASKDKQTPLHCVVENIIEILRVPDLDIVKLLVDNGAKFDVKDSDGYTALRSAALWGQKDTVKFFLSKGVDTSSLHMAACAGDLSRVKKLIAEGTKVDQEDEKGWTALFWAASAGQTEVAEFLIDNSADISADDGHGQSLLHQAALTNAVKLAELLIAKGADVNAKSSMGRGKTPLHLACGRGNKEVAELLINKGADINVNTGLMDETPLFYATRYGRKEVVELLIAKGADKNVRNSRGSTAFHIAVEEGHTEIVKLLMAAGANVNTRKRNGSTSLHQTSSTGNLEMVKILISAGADVNISDNLGRAPLDLAEKNGHTEIIELLKKYGAKKGTPTLFGAVNAGDIELVQSLISKGADVNARGYFGRTPLHYKPSKSIAELLIAKGADVNAKTNFGMTPLHGTPSKPIAELLIAKGADVNAKDNLGMTPLHYTPSESIAELLIAKGADVNAKNKWNLTPINIAVNRGHTEIVELLRKHGAKE